MEASDVFATPGTAPQEIGEDDPFAGTDFGDVDLGSPEPSTATEPERPIPEPTPELPTVDREGAVVTPGTGPSDPAANGAAYAEANAAPERTTTTEPQVGPTPEAQVTLDAMKQTTHPVADPTPEAPAVSAGPTETTPDPTAASPSSSTPASDPEPSSAETPAAESSDASPASEPTPDPTPSSSEPSPAEAAAEAEVVEAEPGDAPPPAELRDSGGRTTHRRYRLLKPLGNGRYDTLYWWVDKDGNMVAQGTRGAKRQKFALCRSQEDALKVGYAALGAPPKATVVAVAVSSFQERTIEPDPPKPERARLKIS